MTRLLKSNRYPGFTLIELLIVVAIIAILAAIAVPNFLEAQVRAKVARSLADMRSMATALESYAVDNNRYVPYSRITSANVVQGIATAIPPGPPGGPNDDKNEFSNWRLTTPIGYLTVQLNDSFASQIEGPKPEIFYYNYLNMAQHILLNPTLPADVIEKTGSWRMSAAGPDLDRGADTKLNIIYDPTNGSVSDGDIVRTQRSSQSQLR